MSQLNIELTDKFGFIKQQVKLEENHYESDSSGTEMEFTSSEAGSPATNA